MAEGNNLVPFLDAKKAHDAFVTFVLPGIEEAMRRKRVKRSHLHVVVLNPRLPFKDGCSLPIMFEHSVGDPKEWEHEYDAIARSKARVTWRTGLPSREVVLMKPHLLLPDDTRYWGSAIVDGIITAVSGVEPYFDEAFSRMTSSVLSAIATDNASRFAAAKDAPDFIPHEATSATAFISAENRRGIVYERDYTYVIEPGRPGAAVLSSDTRRGMGMAGAGPIIEVDAGPYPFRSAYAVLCREVDALERRQE